MRNNTFLTDSKLTLKFIAEMSKKYSELFPKFSLKRFLVAYRYKTCPFELFIKYIRGKKILDIGCGSGFLLYCASELDNTQSLTGIEGSKQVSMLAQELLSKMTSKETTILCAPTIEDYPNEMYDTISMIDVLHHIPPQIQVDFMKNAIAKVKPGGVFIFKEMSDKNFFCSLMNRLHDLVLAKQIIHYANLDEIEKTFLEQGFKCIDKQRKRMFWYDHKLYVFSKVKEN